jgi:calcium permeable stress-gated cation channel
MSKGAHRTRSFIGEFLVLLIICCYVVPLTLVALLLSESAIASISPRLAQLDDASAIFSAAIALVQPLSVVGLQQLVPPLFIAIGRAEGIISFSEVQMRAFSRYFVFQVLNVFLVTTIAGSIL